MNERHEVRVLFVCMGNICRSPTAHGVFRARVEAAGLDDRIDIDSAGTHGFHIGKPPDRRAVAVAARRGYPLGDLRARAVRARDLGAFDYVLAMDRANRRGLLALAEGAGRERVQLLLDYAREGQGHGEEVPDPYTGGIAEFEQVLDRIEVGTAGLLAHLRERHGW